MLLKWSVLFLTTFFIDTVNLSLVKEPKLVLMPAGSVQYKAIHSFTMVGCQASGVDTPIPGSDLRWIDPLGRVIPKEQSLRVYAEFAKETLMLLAKHTVKEDDGLYTCEANYEGKKLSVAFELKTFLDLTWEDVPPVQHPRVNTSGYIKCKARAEPLPEVDWKYNNNNMVFKEGDRCQPTTEGLYCQPILKQDDGLYTCRARVMPTGKIEFREIRVEVHTPPQIKNLTESLTVIEDERVTLTCVADGDPQPFYSWEDKSNANLKGRPGFIVDELKGTLTIESVSKEDTGQLQCVANNSAGEDTRRTALTVVVKPKILKFEDATAVKDQKGKISCHVQADPIVTVQFSNVANQMTYSYVAGDEEEDEDDMPEERIYVSHVKSALPSGIFEDVYTLEFSSVERSDDAIYRCTATNMGGSVSEVSHLQVEYSPEFTTSGTTTVWSWIDNYVNLTCSVSAIPNASISWFFKEVPVSQYANMKVEDTENDSVLNILPTDNSFFSQYVCKASNRIGENEMIFELNMAHPPGKLKQVAISPTATTIIATIYGPESQEGFPVTHYAVEYKRHEEQESKRRNWDVGIPYVLEKLEPQKQYNFRFAAVNKVGDGEWLEDWWNDATFTMPAKAAPLSPPVTSAKEDYVTLSPFATKYKLTWDVPPDNGDKITHFKINYCEVRNSSGRFDKISDWTEEKIPYPGQTLYSVKGLKPDSFYKIEIRAENSIGSSVPSTVIIQTAKDPYSVNPKMDSRPVALDDASEQATMASVSIGLIVAIAVAALIVIVVVVDISCYLSNKCGVFMFLCVHVCKKHPSGDKVKEVSMEDGGGVKSKDSKEAKLVVAAPEAAPAADDDESKDATEETPMIDGKNNKKGTETITAQDNDTIMRPRLIDGNAVAV